MTTPPWDVPLDEAEKDELGRLMDQIHSGKRLLTPRTAREMLEAMRNRAAWLSVNKR